MPQEVVLSSGSKAFKFYVSPTLEVCIGAHFEAILCSLLYAEISFMEYSLVQLAQTDELL